MQLLEIQFRVSDLVDFNVAMDEESTPRLQFGEAALRISPEIEHIPATVLGFICAVMALKHAAGYHGQLRALFVAIACVWVLVLCSRFAGIARANQLSAQLCIGAATLLAAVFTYKTQTSISVIFFSTISSLYCDVVLVMHVVRGRRASADKD